MAKDLTELLRLATEEAQNPTPKPSVVRGAAPKQVSGKLMPAVPKASGGGGIASPLTEKGYNTRAYWAAINLQSTDGFITIKWEPPYVVHFADANGNDVDLIYSEPQ